MQEPTEKDFPSHTPMMQQHLRKIPNRMKFNTLFVKKNQLATYGIHN